MSESPDDDEWTLRRRSCGEGGSKRCGDGLRSVAPHCLFDPGGCPAVLWCAVQMRTTTSLQNKWTRSDNEAAEPAYTDTGSAHDDGCAEPVDTEEAVDATWCLDRSQLESSDMTVMRK